MHVKQRCTCKHAAVWMLGFNVKSFKTAGAIQVNVSVMNVTPQQSGNEAFLSGQTLTSLDASGVANIQDLILRAAPGFYNLAVALAEYPQVTLLATLLLWCAAVEIYHIRSFSR